jgi:hypothetical protein
MEVWSGEVEWSVANLTQVRYLHTVPLTPHTVHADHRPRSLHVHNRSYLNTPLERDTHAMPNCLTLLACFSLLRPFVSPSAAWRSVGTCTSAMVPSSRCCRIKW